MNMWPSTEGNMTAVRYTRELIEEAARETTNFDDAPQMDESTSLDMK